MAKTVDILEKLDAALGGTEGDAKNIKESLLQIVEALGSGDGLSRENGEFTGTLTLGKGTADEVTITAAQLKALIALLGLVPNS